MAFGDLVEVDNVLDEHLIGDLLAGKEVIRVHVAREKRMGEEAFKGEKVALSAALIVSELRLEGGEVVPTDAGGCLGRKW